MNYGKHLLVEVICRTPKNLTNVRFIKNFLQATINELHFNPLAPPKLFKFPPPGGGITGYCIINESHLAIHTWPEKNYFTFDVFSCRDFNEKKVEKLLNKFFDIQNVHREKLERGLSINF